MTYSGAFEYLDSFVNYEKVSDYSYNASFNLKRMECLLEALGNPHLRFRSVHIAGTKGKGSCAAMIASILREAGFRIGLYTSPHLVSPRERIRVLDKFKIENSKLKIGDSKLKIGEREIEGAIPEEDLCELLAKIKPAVKEIQGKPDLGEVSFFEIYTLLAFLYFAQNEVDFAILEVGMGGRLDATNVVKPLVSVITPISFDHTDKLGSTLESIAKEKAGIIKEGVPCVSAPQEDAAYSVIRRTSRERGVSLYEVGKDILFEIVNEDQMWIHFYLCGLLGEYGNLKLPLLGRHQVINAAAALGAVELLSNYEVLISDSEVRRGLRDVAWPGRLQVIGEHPWIVLDGAQNRASARALMEAIKGIFSYKDLVLVLGVSLNKDIRGVAEELCPISREVILTQAPSTRAAEPEAILEVIGGLCPKITLTNEVEEAMELARKKSSSDDLILVTGSLYVIGELIRLMKEKVHV